MVTINMMLRSQGSVCGIAVLTKPKQNVRSCFNVHACVAEAGGPNARSRAAAVHSDACLLYHGFLWTRQRGTGVRVSESVLLVSCSFELTSHAGQCIGIFIFTLLSGRSF